MYGRENQEVAREGQVKKILKPFDAVSFFEVSIFLNV